MQPAGLAEVERAKADGRWEAAYAGPATHRACRPISSAALDAEPRGLASSSTLDSQNRYAILYRIDDRQARRDAGTPHRAVRRNARARARRSTRRSGLRADV